MSPNIQSIFNFSSCPKMSFTIFFCIQHSITFHSLQLTKIFILALCINYSVGTNLFCFKPAPPPLPFKALVFILFHPVFCFYYWSIITLQRCVSALQQSESALCIHTSPSSPASLSPPPFHLLSHHRKPRWSPELSVASH